MDMEPIVTLMEPNTKVIGRKINKMEKDLSHGQMALHTKVIINKEKNVVLENSSGRMDQYMKGNLVTTISMAGVFIYGATKDNMLEIGKITKWTDMEFLHGLITECILENIRTIKKKVMGSSNGINL